MLETSFGDLCWASFGDFCVGLLWRMCSTIIAFKLSILLSVAYGYMYTGIDTRLKLDYVIQAKIVRVETHNEGKLCQGRGCGGESGPDWACRIGVCTE